MPNYVQTTEVPAMMDNLLSVIEGLRHELPDEVVLSLLNSIFLPSLSIKELAVEKQCSVFDEHLQSWVASARWVLADREVWPMIRTAIELLQAQNTSAIASGSQKIPTPSAGVGQAVSGLMMAQQNQEAAKRERY